MTEPSRPRSPAEKSWEEIEADLERLPQLRAQTREALKRLRRTLAIIDRQLGLPADEELV